MSIGNFTPATPRILVPLANAESVPQLARAASLLADRLHAEIHLLHVVDAPLMPAHDSRSARLRDAELLFEAARAVVPSRIAVRTHVRVGPVVGHEIRTVARETRSAVVLVGWRPGFSLRTLVVGALQPVLHRPPCDVLVLDLEQRGVLERIVTVPSGDADSVGLRIVAAVASASSSGVLLQEPAVPSLGDCDEVRPSPIQRRLAQWAPTLRIEVLRAPVGVPLHRIVQATSRALLVLVTPFGADRRPRVRGRHRGVAPRVVIVGA